MSRGARDRGDRRTSAGRCSHASHTRGPTSRFGRAQRGSGFRPEGARRAPARWAAGFLHSRAELQAVAGSFPAAPGASPAEQGPLNSQPSAIANFAKKLHASPDVIQTLNSFSNLGFHDPEMVQCNGQIVHNSPADRDEMDIHIVLKIMVNSGGSSRTFQLFQVMGK